MLRRLTATGTAVLLGVTVVLLGSASARAAPIPGPAAAKSRAADADADADVEVIAHRGASAYAPENTLPAVTLAHDLGAVWVENDVQRTKDGRLVVIHDTTLSRTTDVEERYPDRAPWNVRDFTLAEIARLDAGSWFDEEFAGERVPTLEQYLELLAETGQKLLLEIKAPQLYPGIEKDTLRVLRAYGWLEPDRVGTDLVVQSFSAASVKAVHGLAPRVRTGFLGTPKTADLRTYARFSDQINPPHKDITPGYVTAVHQVEGAHGDPLEVHTWTVDDWVTARRVVDAGVDGVITNRPDVVLDAVGDRWASLGVG